MSMKVKVVFFLSMLFVLSLMSCSNESEGGQIIANEDYSQVLTEAQPYISSGMQELIERLDTVSFPLPIEEVVPFIENIVSKDSLSNSAGVITRTNIDGTTVTNGYSKETTLFYKKAVSISNSSSSLRESLGYNFILNSSSDSEVVYLTCKALCNYVYFASNVSFFSAYASGDFMGINPEVFNADITNNSILEQGFYSEEKVAGRLYYLTTYIFEAYAYSDGVVIRILPSNGVTYSDLETYTGRLQWRYYAL